MKGPTENKGQPPQTYIPGIMSGLGNFVLHSVQSSQVVAKVNAFTALRDKCVESVRNVVKRTDARVNTVLAVWIEDNATAYPGAILTMLHQELKLAKEEEGRFGFLRKAGDWGPYRQNLEAVIKSYPAENMLEAAESLITAWSKLQADTEAKLASAKALEDKVEALTEENRQLREKAIANEATATQTAQALADLRNEVERLKPLADKKVALEAEIATLTKQLDATDLQIAKLEDDKAKLVEEKNEYKAKAEANAQMATELAVKTALLDQAQKRIAELEKQLAEEKQDNKEIQANILKELREKRRLDQTVDPAAHDSLVSASFVGAENAFGGRSNVSGMFPRDLNASGVSNGHRAKLATVAHPVFAAPQNLKKSAHETVEEHAANIAKTLGKLRATKKVSEQRINAFELLGRFLSHFNPDDHNADDCIAVIDAYKVLAADTSDPKVALDNLIQTLSEVQSVQGQTQFSALLKDLSQLTARTTPRGGVASAVRENLGHVTVVAELKNLTLPTRFNIPTLNHYFEPIYEAAEVAARQAKAAKSAGAPNVASKPEVPATPSTDNVFGITLDNTDTAQSVFGK